jgi:hypothetical protein
VVSIKIVIWNVSPHRLDLEASGHTKTRYPEDSSLSSDYDLDAVGVTDLILAVLFSFLTLSQT